MQALRALLYSLLAGLTAALAGCGGGDSAVATGIGGTGKIASGSITRFGSVFVNGVEYAIDAARCSIDDNDTSGKCQAGLALGMVVTVEGNVSGTTGTASTVVFESSVEGPVAGLASEPDGLTRRFNVLGLDVTVDTAGTRFDGAASGFGFDTLAEGNVVKVSGFRAAAGALNATYVGKVANSVSPGTTLARLRGSVANLSGGGGPGSRFTLNGVTVDVLSATRLVDLPGGRVSDGTFVAVSGVITGATSVDASRIELTSPTVGEDGDEVSIEGVVSGFSGNPAAFQVDGRSVDAGNATLEPAGLQLRDGLRVEIDGVIRGTTLVASEVESRSDEVKIDAYLTARTADTLTVSLGDGAITVNVDSRTRIEDSTGSVENPLLSDLNPGDFVQIRGFGDASGVTATEIQRESPDSVLLQGPVDDFSPGTSLSVLGIGFFTDGATGFEDQNDVAIGSTTFYATLAIGDVIKIEDRAPGDGTADEVDLED